MTDKTMLVAFDGSPESRRALEYAAKLLQPRTVEILTAWEPLHRQAARSVSLITLGVEPEDPAHSAALKICQEGVELAQSLGLEARAHMVESATAVWSAIVDAADELRPDVIVTAPAGSPDGNPCGNPPPQTACSTTPTYQFLSFHPWTKTETRTKKMKPRGKNW